MNWWFPTASGTVWKTQFNLAARERYGTMEASDLVSAYFLYFPSVVNPVFLL